MVNIYVYAPDLDSDDIEALNRNAEEYGINYDLFIEHGLVDPGLIHVIIELAQNVGYSAVYDLVRYGVLKLLTCFKDKGKESYTLKVTCENKSTTIQCTRALTREQEDKIIDRIMDECFSQQDDNK